VTFNPEATSSQPSRLQGTQKPKRRVSLGVVVNAETGEVIEGGAGTGTGTVGVKRHSQRRHTIMNTSATVNRIKDAEEKRVRAGFFFGHRRLLSCSWGRCLARRLRFQRRPRWLLDYRRKTNSSHGRSTPKRGTLRNTEIIYGSKKRNVPGRAW
jgi:hypothetical protein